MSSDPNAANAGNAVRIGKYEVVSHIATGGMGAVYKARDPDTGRLVAVKVLSPEMASQQSMVVRFKREARSVGKLRHDNIVTLYEFGEAAGTYFLALEFIDGRDLHEYVEKKGPLSAEEALDYMIQACRALDHAHRCNIVHRDIKPSNFLLTSREGRPLIKLTDMGLAREVDKDENRVTKAGTTVGTLDFMSPEQARDSGSADIRSDLYSLGGTWFFLLTGQPPFPGGGLGERLFRIMNEEPPDVRTLNPDVPEGVAATIQRLLLKDPRYRYQNPKELLDDLYLIKQGEDILTTRELPAAVQPVAKRPKSSPKSKRPSSSGAPRPPSSSAGRKQATAVSADSDTAVDARSSPRRSRRKRRRRAWPWILLALTLFSAVTGAGVWGLLRYFRPPPSPSTQHTAFQTGTPNLTPDPPAEDAPIIPPTNNTNPTVVPTRPSRRPVPTPPRTSRTVQTPAPWKRLYEPSPPVNATAKRKEMEVPWAAANPPPEAPAILAVSRSQPGPGIFYRSLADAEKAAPAGKPCVLEIHDNGPFFDAGLTAKDRHVTIRPARGYHPLLVWDVGRTLADRSAVSEGADTSLVFADIQRGSLTLVDIDLAVNWPQTEGTGPATLLRLREADLRATDCIFSASGQPRGGCVLARLLGASSTAPRCRLTRCVSRGDHLTALDVEAPAAEVLLDGCLLVSTESPLIQVRAENDLPAVIRAVRSTAVAGPCFVSVRPARAVVDRTPTLRFVGWDLLVSHASSAGNSDLLRLEGNADPDHIFWQATNCIYAGWDNLLGGSHSIAATSAGLRQWWLQWYRVDGDYVAAGPWPSSGTDQAAELAPRACALMPDLPVAFAGTADPNLPLGCNVADLPKSREQWVALTCTDAEQPPTLPEGAPPEIPFVGDGRFHGMPMLNLDRDDLGAFLQREERSRGLGPNVVLHLTGSGTRPMTPIHLVGHSLTLYFPPSEHKGELPLTLIPGSGHGQALIDIDGGNLEIIGANLRIPEGASVSVPWLIRVRGGDLRLNRCRLETPPMAAVPPTFQGLIHFSGSGQVQADAAQQCLMNNVVLASGRDGIHVEGVGASLWIHQGLLATWGSAVTLSPGSAFDSQANLRCVFDRCTVAAHEGAVNLALGGCTASGPSDPVIVHSHSSAFLNPFRDRGGHKGLLLAEGNALPRGLVLWQSEHDVFDRRLQFGVWTDEKNAA